MPSLGLLNKRYKLTDSNVPDFSGLTNLTLINNAVTPLVGFFSSNGAPLGLNFQENFASRYTGFFYTGINSGATNFTFKVIGHGFLRVRVNNTWLIGGSSSYQTLEQHAYTESNTITLPINSWTEILIDYYKLADLAGFVVLWKDDINDMYIPLSAGATSQTQSFLPTKTLNYVSDVSGFDSDTEVSEFSFNIPIVKPLNTTNGYKYDRNKDRYVDVLDSELFLKKYSTIISEIIYTDQTIFVQKFIGHITRFELNRKNKNADIIRVHCESFGSLLKETLNLNYPDKFDYWIAEFAGQDFTDLRPDGIDFVPSYDGWPIDKVFKSLLIRGNIDPTLFHKKQLFLNNAESQVEGNFLIEESNPQVVLERGRNYGGPSRIFFFEKPDDEYRLKTNFGDNLFDYINSAIEPYGWEWGIHSFYDGVPYLRTRNNPTEIISSEANKITLNGAGWGSKLTDLDVISGTYRETSANTNYVETLFTGQRLDFISALYSGVSGGMQLHITSGISSTRFQYEDNLGDTPAVGHRIIFELPDGNEVREINLINTPSSGHFDIDSALSEIPVSGTRVRSAVAQAEIRRGSTWAGGITIATTYIPSFYEHGLEKVIASTRYKPLQGPLIVSGTKRFFYHGFDDTNAQNPTIFNLATDLTRDEHIVKVSRLTNAESGSNAILGFNSFFVYDKDRNLPTYTFRTGDTVASGTLTELDVKNSGEDIRNDVIVVGRRLGAIVPGGGDSPPLNPNNPVSEFIISRAVDLHSISNENANNFLGRPSQSIIIEPSIGSQDRADYWAVSFLNRFRFPSRETGFSSLAHPLMEIGDCIYVDDEKKDSIDTSNKLWITGIDSNWGQKKAIDKYETTNFPPWESFIPKVPVSISDFGAAVVDIQITNGGSQGSPYDPYSSDESGTFVEIKFDLVVSGFVRVQIFSHDGKFIADLLNSTGEDGQKGYIRDTFGSNKKVIWDGVDLEGSYNEEHLKDEVENLQGFKNWFVAEDSGLGDLHGKFYVRFTVVDFSGTTHIIQTDKLTPAQFIFTNRGEPIDATMTLNPSFTPGSADGFLDTDNTDRGLEIAINDITSAGDRPAQLRIEIIPWILGRVVIIGTGARNFPPRTPEFIEELTLGFKNESFIKYDGTLTSSFFKPTDQGLIEDNFDQVFLDGAKTVPGLTQLQIGWYFGIVAVLSDKSGRTKKLTGVAYWDGTSTGKLTSNGTMIITEEQSAITGDTDLHIGSVITGGREVNVNNISEIT